VEFLGWFCLVIPQSARCQLETARNAAVVFAENKIDSHKLPVLLNRRALHLQFAHFGVAK